MSFLSFRTSLLHYPSIPLTRYASHLRFYFLFNLSFSVSCLSVLLFYIIRPFLSPSHHLQLLKSTLPFSLFQFLRGVAFFSLSLLLYMSTVHLQLAFICQNHGSLCCFLASNFTIPTHTHTHSPGLPSSTSSSSSHTHILLIFFFFNPHPRPAAPQIYTTKHLFLSQGFLLSLCHAFSALPFLSVYTFILFFSFSLLLFVYILLATSSIYQLPFSIYLSISLSICVCLSTSQPIYLSQAF